MEESWGLVWFINLAYMLSLMFSAERREYMVMSWAEKMDRALGFLGDWIRVVLESSEIELRMSFFMLRR